MAVAQTTNAPTGLTEAQIVGIYKGEITNWSAVGGADGAIKPLIPRAGSGTRSFFEGELKRMNGGTGVVPAPSVVPVREHDDSAIKADPNAVAPFSVGRAGLLGTLRIETGFSAARALYNVVRQPDVSSTWARGIFGPTGFICSPAASSLILDAGFEQLLSQGNGGKCGVSTTTATPVSDLLTAKVNTTTTVAGTSATVGALALTATVAGGGQLKPQGTVAFAVDGAAKGNAIVTGGKATLNLTGLAAGEHTVVATFTPTGAAFNGSASAATKVNVTASAPVMAKATTKLVEKFKASYPKAASYKGKVLVKETSTFAPTGKIVVKRGKKTVGKGTIKSGKVVLTLKKLKKGKNKLTTTYAGDSKFTGSKLKFKIVIK
ncbi:Ig-like domain repeat protein [Nocardioides sp. B-3]|uniref:Ig-like domain repeat protein n=1 Tax=Nocardioides sp. B-3 TaxID=2895565 RepID=UPI0021522D22|nr:Ig-like domain repeat protein [Nocardioides sp. B-3]UUZ61566.1 Ig-like domain repeat protein [Nocardioides sp. B-3]